jgi:hypothetical protein
MCSEWCNLQRRCRHRRLLCECRAVRRNRESTSSSRPLAGDARGSQMGFDDSPFQKLVEQNAGLDNMIQTWLTSDGGLIVSGRVEQRRLPWHTCVVANHSSCVVHCERDGAVSNGEALPVSLRFERSLPLRSLHRRQQHQLPLLDRTGVRGRRPIC